MTNFEQSIIELSKRKMKLLKEVQQINHLSINMFDEFAEEKVNKLMVFLSEHGSRGVVVEV